MAETYARLMLQLSIILESRERLSLEGLPVCFVKGFSSLERCEVFLEVFGNILIRDFTASYTRHMANRFIKYRLKF